jgi:subtilase family serine protease
MRRTLSGAALAAAAGGLRERPPQVEEYPHAGPRRSTLVKIGLSLAVSLAAPFAVSACAGGSSGTVPAANRVSAGALRSVPARTVAACVGSRVGMAQCDVLYHPGVRPDVPSGWGATDLEAAYALPVAGGPATTVAVVDAYDDPDAVSDFNAYRAGYALPAATLLKYNQTGQQSNYPKRSRGWALEESLDVDMMSAGCPTCTVLLVEANSNKFADLEVAENEAIALGATVISNSYSGHGATESYYDHSGVTILASAGDDGYGISEPAEFPSVVAVGGTVLSQSGPPRGYSELAWGGTGSGCSKQAKPKWEKPGQTPGCSGRVANDVSAVATNVAVYDTLGGGWTTVDGTSVSSPLIGAVFGLAGNATQQDGGQTFWEAPHHAFLNDITSGANGSCNPSYLCNAGPGYDGPTGWGTPNGVGAF